MSSPMTFPVASPESLGISSAAIERCLDHASNAHFELKSPFILRYGQLSTSGWWRTEA